MSIKILAINPGSTSTKIALFEDGKEVFSSNLDLEGVDYKSKDGKGNFEKLKASVVREVEKHGIKLSAIDAYAGRSGYMGPSEGGVYEINQRMLEMSRIEDGGVHASTYSPHLTYALAREYGKKAYVLNSQEADELNLSSRVLGYPEVWRMSGIHVLNQKEVAAQLSERIGKKYSEANLIVAHLGGGFSIVAHKEGKMVDFSGAAGEGPMAPTRSGTVPAMKVIQMAFSGEYTMEEMLRKTNLQGGLMGHLGTSDARIVEARIAEGDEYAKLVYDAMIYQICKNIGAMTVTLQGRVDAIGVTGGLSNSKYLVNEVRKQTGWIAPIFAFPGEYEMECLGNSVLRVLRGEEETKVYTGIPVFDVGTMVEKREKSLRDYGGNGKV